MERYRDISIPIEDRSLPEQITLFLKMISLYKEENIKDTARIKARELLINFYEHMIKQLRQNIKEKSDE